MTIDLRNYVSSTHDFPKKGIIFRDINPLIGNGKAYREAINQIVKFAQPLKPDLIVGPEARGFFIGAPMAYKMGLGFVPARKVGKLPRKTIEAQYDTEYGKSRLEMHIDAIKPGQRIFIVDDLLATGGTICAVIRLINKLKGNIIGGGFFIELTDLKGQKEIKNLVDVPLKILMKY